MNKILVVDDEPQIVGILKELLTKNGFKVMTAGGGEKAIEILKSDAKIDLMLLDMKMPGVKGTEVLEEIDRLNKHISCIILTGSIDAQKYKAELKRLGLSMDSILYKPIDLHLLLDMVKKKLGLGK